VPSSSPISTPDETVTDRQRLLSEWDELLIRRGPLRESLGLYREILALWAGWHGGAERRSDREETWCHAQWERGAPLLAEGEPPVSRSSLDPLVWGALDLLRGIREEDAAGLARLAEAWDTGAVAPSAFLPARAHESQQRLGLSSDLFGFFGQIVLRPPLEEVALPFRDLIGAAGWDRGICPICGLPAAFSDVGDDGKRRLVCHLCGSEWGFARIRCASCDNRDPNTLKILSAEEEEGYFIEACGLCRGYLKGLDRRLRWNVVSSLLEDWGSPHLDLIALDRGYWRGVPTLLLLARES